MLGVDSVEGLLGVRAPFCVPLVQACFIAFFRYIRMHNFAAAHSCRCEFTHLCSGGVRLLFEVRAWLSLLIGRILRYAIGVLPDIYVLTCVDALLVRG